MLLSCTLQNGIAYGRCNFKDLMKRLKHGLKNVTLIILCAFSSKSYSRASRLIRQRQEAHLVSVDNAGRRKIRQVWCKLCKKWTDRRYRPNAIVGMMLIVKTQKSQT